MHQIARLLELPGNVGPSCPSPPSLNLHSLRKEAAAKSELEICRGRCRSPIDSADKSSHHFNGSEESSVRVPSLFVSLLRFESNDHNISIITQSSQKPEIDNGRKVSGICSPSRIAFGQDGYCLPDDGIGGDNLDVLGIHRHCYV